MRLACDGHATGMRLACDGHATGFDGFDGFEGARGGRGLAVDGTWPVCRSRSAEFRREFARLDAVHETATECPPNQVPGAEAVRTLGDARNRQ